MAIPIAAILAGAGTFLGMKFLSAGPINNAFNTLMNNIWANERHPVDACLRLRLWEVYDDVEFYDRMQAWGYDHNASDDMLLSQRVYLDSGSIVTLGRREGQSDEEIAQVLHDHGWKLTEAQRLVKVMKFYPSAEHLVNWSAKEVFEPEMVQRYGLDDEFENLELDAFHKAGMTDEQVRNYWRAHWEHASWRQVTEMLQRGQLTEDEVYDWFRLVEIPPFWRDKLTAISYHPFTRVDVRRMHKIGTIDDAGLVRAYKDVGFNQEKAEAMRDFTIQYNKQSGESTTRDLTRAQIEGAYEVGFIGREETKTMLSDMGYDDTETEFILGLSDQDQSLDYARDWLSLLRNQVGAGLKSVDQMETKLTDLGFSPEAVSHYRNLFLAFKEEPTKMPSKTDIKNWFKHELIEESKAQEYLEGIGYDIGEIDLYLEDWSGGTERYKAWREKQMEIERELREG